MKSKLLGIAAAFLFVFVSACFEEDTASAVREDPWFTVEAYLKSLHNQEFDASRNFLSADFEGENIADTLTENQQSFYQMGLTENACEEIGTYMSGFTAKIFSSWQRQETKLEKDQAVITVNIYGLDLGSYPELTSAQQIDAYFQYWEEQNENTLLAYQQNHTEQEFEQYYNSVGLSSYYAWLDEATNDLDEHIFPYTYTLEYQDGTWSITSIDCLIAEDMQS